MGRSVADRFCASPHKYKYMFERVIHIAVWSSAIGGFIAAFAFFLLLPQFKIPYTPVSDFGSLRLDQNGELVMNDGTPVYLTDSIHGFVDAMTMNTDSVAISGWAGDIKAGVPVQAIVVLIGDRVVAHGRADNPRPDVASHFRKEGLTHTGYKLTVAPVDLTRSAKLVLRVFAVDQGGRVNELGYKEKLPLRHR